MGFSLFSRRTWIEGARYNRLNEAVITSTLKFCFQTKIIKIMKTPLSLPFHYINWILRGCSLHGLVNVTNNLRVYSYVLFLTVTSDRVTHISQVPLSVHEHDYGKTTRKILFVGATW